MSGTSSIEQLPNEITKNNLIMSVEEKVNNSSNAPPQMQQNQMLPQMQQPQMQQQSDFKRPTSSNFISSFDVHLASLFDELRSRSVSLTGHWGIGGFLIFLPQEKGIRRFSFHCIFKFKHSSKNKFKDF